MEASYIKLLKSRIEKLSEGDFDLEAWKSGTISVIERIFGEKDGRIKKVNDLKVDYSSWALRDATSKYNPVETCKKKGKELLQTLIEEIEILGIQSEKQNPLEQFPEKLRSEIEKAIEEDDMETVEKKIKSAKKELLADALLSFLRKT